MTVGGTYRQRSFRGCPSFLLEAEDVSESDEPVVRFEQAWIEVLTGIPLRLQQTLACANCSGGHQVARLWIRCILVLLLVDRHGIVLISSEAMELEAQDDKHEKQSH